MMGFEKKTLAPNNLSPDPNMQDLATPKLLQTFKQTNQVVAIKLTTRTCMILTQY